MALADGRLASHRVRDAVSRIRELAIDVDHASAAEPIPEYVTSGDQPEFPLARAIDAFDIRPGTVVPANPVYVSLETSANIAVGASPWGLAAAGYRPVPIREGDTLPDTESLVIVGKDNHRRPWVRDLIDRARKRHPATLVVDMGWPSDDRLYADVATFGSSRYVGLALAAWLEKAETQ